MRRTVFVTGGTGYLGRALIQRLLERGHSVHALVREGSESKLPRGALAVSGDALRSDAWSTAVPRECVFVHLVGTPKPAPWKVREFERVDLASVDIAIDAARRASVSHFVYLSVAQPAPVMRAYQAARAEGERLIAAAFARASFVRPWYVLGPGHRWPLALRPIYWLAERTPSMRDGARRLGLVTLEQMTTALVAVVKRDTTGIDIVDVPAIRALAVAHAREPRDAHGDFTT